MKQNDAATDTGANHETDQQTLFGDRSGQLAKESRVPAGKPDAGAHGTAVTLDDVSISFGDHVAVRNVTLQLPARLGSLDVYGTDVQPEVLRSRIGMVFQKPNPFPTMSIFDNVISGLRFNGVRNKRLLREMGIAALHNAALWDIVKDRLHQPALRLSGGQQQRLCIARALAIEPEVLLMDEPCSALDPVATAKIEDLIRHLSGEVTIALVTHNMFQAARVSDNVAVFLLGDDRVGELVEVGPTDRVFDTPDDARTKAYVSGHVG